MLLASAASSSGLAKKPRAKLRTALFLGVEEVAHRQLAGHQSFQSWLSRLAALALAAHRNRAQVVRPIFGRTIRWGNLSSSPCLNVRT